MGLPWKKQFKGDRVRGGAYIYIHPEIDRAIVHNHLGIQFNGKAYSTLDEAKRAAEENAKLI